MSNQSTNENAGIRFAYIRDPMCYLRVVTIAYTNNPAIQAGENHVQKQSLTYAFAINRVDTRKRDPHRAKNHETFDMHCKAAAREIAGYRLRNMGSTSVGHCYANIGQSPVQAIIAEHLRQHRPLKRRCVPETPMYLQKVFEVFLRVVQLAERK